MPSFVLAVTVVALGFGVQGAAIAATPPVRALIDEDQGVVPLYDVSGGGATTGVGYILDGDSLLALNQDGDPVWEPISISVPDGKNLWGGLDFDQDGWPDPGVITETYFDGACGPDTALNDVELFSGKTGQEASPPVNAMANCQPNMPPNPYNRWSFNAPLYGTGPELALPPVYWTQGWFTRYSAGAWRNHAGQAGHGSDPFVYPNGPWWISAYGAPPANTAYNPIGGIDTHVFNGLITRYEGDPQLVAWTSHRAMVFRVNAAYGPGQLVRDHRYCSLCPWGDAVGRNYGLVARDPASNNVILLAGTDAWSVFVHRSILTQDPNYSGEWPWRHGGISRHFSILDLGGGFPQDRPFSYAHYGPRGSDWEGRLVYPANPFVETGSGPSRIAYSVYSEHTEPMGWNLHISNPGSTDDLIRIPDLYLWDIRDIDGDGTDEWITSPPRFTDDYFPKPRIEIYTWDESNESLVLERTIDGVFPFFHRTFRQTQASASEGWLAPVLSKSTPDGLKLLVTDDGTEPEVAD